MVKYRLLKISMIAVLSVSSSALRRFSTIGNRRCSTTRLCDHSYSFLCKTSDALETIGKRLSSVLSAGDVIFLRGDLGAGKTTLSRGIVREKFGDDEMIVTSPSYLLDNTYKYGKNDYIHHMDLYRLPVGYPDMGILGIPAIFQSALCIVEWPDRLTDQNIPSSYLEVSITMPSLASTQDIPVFSPGQSKYHGEGGLLASPCRDSGSSASDHEGSSGDDSTDAGEEDGEEGEDNEADNDIEEGVDPQPARVVNFRFVGERWLAKAQTLRDILSSSI